MPRELQLIRYIDRFGLDILGRQAGAGELKRMVTVERVVRAYQARASTNNNNWAAWAAANQGDAKLLEIGATYGE